MTGAVKNTAKNTAMGIKRMGVILWCVAAIVLVVWLTLSYSSPNDAGEIEHPVPVSVIITAITLIAALGGVDVWKQGRIAKLTGDSNGT